MLGDLRDRLGPLGAVVGLERFDRLQGVAAVLGVVDLRERGFVAWVRRLRQRITKGPGSRAAGVAMAFKRIESGQARWRAVNAPHLVAVVRAGARFEKGKLVERPHESGGDQQVA